MITPLRVSKYKYNYGRFGNLYEDAAVQPATLPMDASTAQNSNNQNSGANTEDINAKNTVVNQNAPEFQANDVDAMSENEVLNYTYFDIPKNIDDSTRQKLYKRADQIRQNRQNGTSVGQNAQELAKGIIRDAQNFLKNQKL